MPPPVPRREGGLPQRSTEGHSASSARNPITPCEEEPQIAQIRADDAQIQRRDLTSHSLPSCLQA